MADLEKLKDKWLLGFLSYDLKNQFEHLESKHPDGLKFPDIFFFEPTHLINDQNQVRDFANKNTPSTTIAVPVNTFKPIQLKQRISKEEYIDAVKKIKAHIKQGDIYEMNFCMEFYAEECDIDPIETYFRLNELSPTPFSAFLRLRDQYILSASPERFLKKTNNKLLSQPIKGTIRRGKNKEEDEQLKHKLQKDAKERSENVMIVDLVRNDLSKCCHAGSVKVEELYGIYSFAQVHQMISTVSGILDEQYSFSNIMQSLFPMGSMTGAPKIRAMELIEKYEYSKRGVYSGSVGYIHPNGDFDFNVIIRSILYNKKNKYLSFHVGSAITHNADPEKEYEECLLKAEAMINILEKK